MLIPNVYFGTVSEFRAAYTKAAVTTQKVPIALIYDTFTLGYRTNWVYWFQCTLITGSVWLFIIYFRPRLTRRPKISFQLYQKSADLAIASLLECLFFSVGTGSQGQIKWPVRVSREEYWYICEYGLQNTSCFPQSGHRSTHSLLLGFSRKSVSDEHLTLFQTDARRLTRFSAAVYYFTPNN